MDTVTPFAGFGPAAFTWLDAIAADNSREAFDASRATYDAELRTPFVAMLEECAAWTDGTPRLFRQLRDLRFARHRARPYWESVAGELASDDRATARVVDLSTQGLTAMAGCRRPFTRDQLQRYRAALTEGTAGRELARIVEALRAAGGEVHGATLRTVPRGLPRDHPRAELLRHTALYGAMTLAPTRRRRGRRTIGRDAALAHLSSTWAHLDALVQWLEDHVGTPEERPSTDALSAVAA